jgi:hypothetical protein
MISKSVPGFCFVDPTNKNTINIRVTSVNVVTETRRIRAVWTPELAQDLTTLHNIDAERDLTNLLAGGLANEINVQIIRDINDNTRYYREHNLNEVLNRWNRLIPPLGEYEETLPIARRITTQILGNDIVPIRDLTLNNPFIDYNQYFTHDDYQVLPNEEGWFTKGVFESLLIKTDMRPFHFILKNRRRRADIRPLVGL